MSKLSSEVIVAIASRINEYQHIAKLEVSVAGQMAAEDKSMLESQAYITVAIR